MARVKLLDKQNASPEVRELFQKIEDNGARILNLYRAVGHSPAAAPLFLKLGNSLLSKAELSPRLREIAILRIARLAGSEYEWAQHVAIALQVGVNKEQVDSIHRWRESAGFSDEERAVLQYTDEVAVDVKVADKTFETLRKYLSERSIVELTLSIGYWGMVARVLVPLSVELDRQTVGSAADLTGKRKQ